MKREYRSWYSDRLQREMNITFIYVTHDQE